MRIQSWNCRGLGNLRTVRDLCKLVKEKCPVLVFLIETKLRKMKMEQIHCKLGFKNSFVVESVEKSGGLALLWGEEISVDIQNYSNRHINGIITVPNSLANWKFAGFYGHLDATKRYEAWELLRYLANLSPDPWLCLGEFNEVVSMSEKWGGETKSSSQKGNFKSALEDCELTDLGFKGPKYTWANCCEGLEFIKERLDRGVANPGCRDIFPEAEIFVEAIDWAMAEKIIQEEI
jgi:hypothetical protein